ncbi:MAG: ABC transporter ATP-binding protein [Melioribacteraceae bacterium]|jgi:iron complex transport system ATP-binding protein|nr:ABC transporter ATP-binding protein [Melioribacteraceae bacterium]
MNEILFDIKNLSFSFDKKKVLNSLSLNITKADFLSIIGPNGGGKTTLVKCLIRIYKPPIGTILLNNIPLEKISQKELAKQISYVPQISENNFPFTAKEFLMLARYPHLSRFTSISANDKKAVTEAFDITNTNHLSDRHMNTLSGGEKQMIFIAAALAQGGDVIILDEPATFLDPKHEHDIYKILRKIHLQKKKTIVSVTHNINSAILYSDKIAILKNGEIDFYGNSDQVTKDGILEKTYDKKFTFIKHPSCNKSIIVPEVIQ